VTPSAAEPITFRYHFRFDDGRQRDVSVRLDPRTLELQPTPPADPPAWTLLSSNKCTHCPLADGPQVRCPAAVSLVEVVDLFGAACSFDQVDVTIQTPARQYAKRGSLQQAVGSLIGLLLATSGCPVTARLRPLVRFHLPFATDWETTYRVLSMYLLAQFLIARRDGRPDWELSGLSTIYRDLRLVNRHLSKRLILAGPGDAHVNALLVLDAFADIISFSLDERRLDELEALFGAYLPPEAA
jgi:hypothetical protein